MKQLLFFLVCGTIVCSCTITKRHFGNGYHVEWNRKARAVTNKDTEEGLALNSPDMNALKNTTIESESLMIDPYESFEQVITTPAAEILEKQMSEAQKDEPLSKSEVEIQTNEEIKAIESNLTKETDDETKELSKRRMHPLMWGIWAMWSIAIACMFFVTFYAEFLIGVGIGFFIAMIFAMIVIRGLRKHPEKYGFKRLSYPFAILAIVFGGIALAGLLLFLGGGYGISY